MKLRVSFASLNCNIGIAKLGGSRNEVKGLLESLLFCALIGREWNLRNLRDGVVGVSMGRNFV